LLLFFYLPFQLLYPLLLFFLLLVRTSLPTSCRAKYRDQSDEEDCEASSHGPPPL
jgi:hypothetical protein